MIRNSKLSPFPGGTVSLFVCFIWINVEMILYMQFIPICVIFHHDNGNKMFTYTNPSVSLVQCGC